MQQDFRPEELNKETSPDLFCDDDESDKTQLPSLFASESGAPDVIAQHAIAAPQLSPNKTLNRNFLEIVIPTFVGLIATIGTFFATESVQWNLFSALACLSIIIVIRFHQQIARLTKSSYPVSSKAASILHLLSMVVPSIGLLMMAMPGYSAVLKREIHDLVLTGISGSPFMFPVVVPAFGFMFIWLQYVVFLCGKGTDKPGAGAWSLTVIVTFLTLWASMSVDIHDFRQMHHLLTFGISVYFSVFYSILSVSLLFLSYKPAERLMQTSDALACEIAEFRTKGNMFKRFLLGLYP